MPLDPFIRLAPLTADTPIEDVKRRIITELEEDRLGFLTSYEQKLAEVYSTEEYADQTVQFNFTNGVEIGGNRPVEILMVAAFSALVAVIVVNKAGPFPFPDWLFYPVSFGVCYGIFRLIPYFNRKIRIDWRGILINDDRFKWADTMGIYVTVVDSAGRKALRREILVIIDGRGNFYGHEFNSLGVSLKKFCAVVEYFRKGSSANISTNNPANISMNQ
jgi:hypothetical protein